MNLDANEAAKNFRLPAALVLNRFDAYGVVIDSSIVVADLRWKALKRRNPASKSQLDRVLDAKILVPFVPDCLTDEVERRIQELSVRHGISLNLMVKEWELLKPQLHFVHIEENLLRDISLRDPSDAPFVAAQRQTNSTVIVSTDNDILESDAPSADRAAIDQADALWKAAHSQAGAALGLLLIGLSPILLVIGAVRFIMLVAKRNPKLAFFSLIAIGIAAWVYRSEIRSKFRELALPEKASRFIVRLLEGIADIILATHRAAEEAQSSLERTLQIPTPVNQKSFT